VHFRGHEGGRSNVSCDKGVLRSIHHLVLQVKLPSHFINSCLLIFGPCKSEVSNFDDALVIDQKVFLHLLLLLESVGSVHNQYVLWLQVPMNKACFGVCEVVATDHLSENILKLFLR